ncbi:unnamed protein product [Amoebophrya sp. A120]|nr:unnamed protein product [Amoebophrya sp. A120]|eukprot:GSA120T00017965001.1
MASRLRRLHIVSHALALVPFVVAPASGRAVDSQRVSAEGDTISAAERERTPGGRLASDQNKGGGSKIVRATTVPSSFGSFGASRGSTGCNTPSYELLRSGADFSQALGKLLLEAKKSVFFVSTFLTGDFPIILESDRIEEADSSSSTAKIDPVSKKTTFGTTTLREVLTSRMARSVSEKILLTSPHPDVGTMFWDSAIVQNLTADGWDVHWLPFYRGRNGLSNLNHAKLYMVDDEHFIVGGIDPFRGRFASDTHDLMVQQTSGTSSPHIDLVTQERQDVAVLIRNAAPQVTRALRNQLSHIITTLATLPRSWVSFSGAAASVFPWFLRWFKTAPTPEPSNNGNGPEDRGEGGQQNLLQMPQEEEGDAAGCEKNEAPTTSLEVLWNGGILTRDGTAGEEVSSRQSFGRRQLSEALERAVRCSAGAGFVYLETQYFQLGVRETCTAPSSSSSAFVQQGDHDVGADFYDRKNNEARDSRTRPPPFARDGVRPAAQGSVSVVPLPCLLIQRVMQSTAADVSSASASASTRSNSTSESIKNRPTSSVALQGMASPEAADSHVEKKNHAHVFMPAETVKQMKVKRSSVSLDRRTKYSLAITVPYVNSGNTLETALTWRTIERFEADPMLRHYLKPCRISTGSNQEAAPVALHDKSDPAWTTSPQPAAIDGQPSTTSQHSQEHVNQNLGPHEEELYRNHTCGRVGFFHMASAFLAKTNDGRWLVEFHGVYVHSKMLVVEEDDESGVDVEPRGPTSPSEEIKPTNGFFFDESGVLVAEPSAASETHGEPGRHERNLQRSKTASLRNHSERRAGVSVVSSANVNARSLAGTGDLEAGIELPSSVASDTIWQYLRRNGCTADETFYSAPQEDEQDPSTPLSLAASGSAVWAGAAGERTSARSLVDLIDDCSDRMNADLRELLGFDLRSMPVLDFLAKAAFVSPPGYVAKEKKSAGSDIFGSVQRQHTTFTTRDFLDVLSGTKVAKFVVPARTVDASQPALPDVDAVENHVRTFLRNKAARQEGFNHKNRGAAQTGRNERNSTALSTAKTGADPEVEYELERSLLQEDTHIILAEKSTARKERKTLFDLEDPTEQDEKVAQQEDQSSDHIRDERAQGDDSGVLYRLPLFRGALLRRNGAFGGTGNVLGESDMSWSEQLKYKIFIPARRKNQNAVVVQKKAATRPGSDRDSGRFDGQTNRGSQKNEEVEDGPDNGRQYNAADQLQTADEDPFHTIEASDDSLFRLLD